MPSPSQHSRFSQSLDQIDSLLAQGHFDQAKTLLLRELARGRGATTRESQAEIASALSVACWGLGELPQAEHYATQSAALLPDDGHAQHNLGNLLVNLGKHLHALPVLDRAKQLLERSDAQLQPAVNGTHRSEALEPVIALSNALVGLHRHDTAVSLLRENLKRHPEEPRLLANLAVSLHASGRVEEALPIALLARERAPHSTAAAELVCAMLNYAPTATKDETFAAHTIYGKVLAADLARQGLTPLHPARRSTKYITATTNSASDDRNSSADRLLRIGLLSGDLRSHSVAYFAWPIIEHAADAGAIINCYHVGIREDDISKQLRTLVAQNAGAWRHAPTTSTAALAEIIYRDHLDVLIDLSGHTTGHRLPVMALRPAPLCCTYFGYPNTTGVSGVDLRLVDSTTDPLGEEPWNTEQLLRLDPLFCAYRPPDGSPEVTPLPAGESDSGKPLTFGCFGSLLKYNTPLIALWARVLRETPNTRLVLMHHGMTEQSVRDRIAQQFADAGVDPKRIVPRAPTPDAKGTFAAYHEIDISLDTWPYSGTTTVCESLWMGVPMVTLAGSGSPAVGGGSGGDSGGESTDRCAARVTASILSAAGLPELIAKTPDQYVAIAKDLADPMHRSRLANMRQTLRSRVLASPICDGKRFTQRLVESLRQAR